MELEYDKNGKLKYHPEFHTRQRRRYTLEELEYLCKFCSVDGVDTIALALERTATSVQIKINELKTTGEYDFYRNINVFYVPVSRT